MEDKSFDREFINNVKNYKFKIPDIVSERIDKTLTSLPEKERRNKENKHKR